MADRLDASGMSGSAGLARAADTPWIVRTHARAHPRARLFCFPYAGGGASIYRTWGSKLPPEIEVCAVQLPGRENRFREPAFNQLAPLLAHLSQQLQPYMTIPFAFFGYSLGALLGFELARLLRRNTSNTSSTRARAEPGHLFVAAHRAVQLGRRSETIHTLPDAEFARALRRLGGTPEAVLQNQELMEVMSPMLRADFQIYEQYTYKPAEPLACPITAFGGALDHTVSEPELAAWSAQTSSTFRLHMLPGDHFFLHSHQDLLICMVAQNLHSLLLKSS